MPIRRLARHLWWLAVMAGLLATTPALPAADSTQPARFLLVFETSHALKKNLPAIEQEIAKLFAANFQYEIQSGDDLAVWTVDESLHTGGFPLASWTPTDAGMEAKQLDDFLDHQKFARHASLEALQPVLNRVVKNSERLTVIIFCDSQSRLTGTPYDSGVNGIITNAAAKYKGGVAPFILVLRSYQGEYLGCSVNRTSTLSFPKFPPPPAPVRPSAPVANQCSAARAARQWPHRKTGTGFNHRGHQVVDQPPAARESDAAAADRAGGDYCEQPAAGHPASRHKPTRRRLGPGPNEWGRHSAGVRVHPGPGAGCCSPSHRAASGQQ